MSFIRHGPWPPNPYHVRYYKRDCAVADAKTGTPAGSVHPVEGACCDKVYAQRYLELRVYYLMSDYEREALEAAETAYIEALQDRAEAERKMAAAKKLIMRLIAPGTGSRDERI